LPALMKEKHILWDIGHISSQNYMKEGDNITEFAVTRSITTESSAAVCYSLIANFEEWFCL
jgi:hypothetical protein